MRCNRGFTLIEIIVVLVIIAILASVALPNYVNYMNQGAAKAAQNNLVAIWGAQKNNYLSNNTYCTTSCSSLANINSNLSLNISDTNFTYACAAHASGFACTATATSISGFSLTVTNASVVLLGGQNCATAAGSACNPSCSPTTSTFCPS